MRTLSSLCGCVNSLWGASSFIVDFIRVLSSPRLGDPAALVEELAQIERKEKLPQKIDNQTQQQMTLSFGSEGNSLHGGDLVGDVRNDVSLKKM